MNADLAGIAADYLDEGGFPDVADMLRRSSYLELLGRRVAVYGPNFIWIGKLSGVSTETIALADVSQVDDTNSHGESSATSEWISDVMIFERAAVCCVVPAKWAE